MTKTIPTQRIDGRYQSVNRARERRWHTNGYLEDNGGQPSWRGSKTTRTWDHYSLFIAKRFAPLPRPKIAPSKRFDRQRFEYARFNPSCGEQSRFLPIFHSSHALSRAPYPGLARYLYFYCFARVRNKIYAAILASLTACAKVFC